MFIHLDEAGDLGLDFTKKKTSKFFIITLLVCETSEALNEARKAAKKTLQRKLNNKTKRLKNELKGAGTTLPIKQYFYKKIAARSDVKIHSIVLNKKRLAATAGRIDQHRIYVKMSHLALQNVGIESNRSFVHIIADRCKRGIEAADFSFTLRTEVEKILPLTSIVTMEQIPSTSDYALQAVDLFSYGMFSKYEFSQTDWYEMFEDKIYSEVLI